MLPQKLPSLAFSVQRQDELLNDGLQHQPHRGLDGLRLFLNQKAYFAGFPENALQQVARVLGIAT